jgi:hypothetical protein
MITPKRKPAKLPLHPDDKAYNRAVNQIRYKIERVIANIKTWRVLHTGYRRPPETITAVLGLIFTYTLRISLHDSVGGDMSLAHKIVSSIT